MKEKTQIVDNWLPRYTGVPLDGFTGQAARNLLEAENYKSKRFGEFYKAAASSAGCHDNYKDVPFHTGFSHRKVGTNCTTCHVPHAAKVDASGCQECHTKVRAQGNRRPPLPFDTTQALRRMANPPSSSSRAPDQPIEPDEMSPLDDELMASAHDEAPPPDDTATAAARPSKSPTPAAPRSREASTVDRTTFPNSF